MVVFISYVEKVAKARVKHQTTVTEINIHKAGPNRLRNRCIGWCYVITEKYFKMYQTSLSVFIAIDSHAIFYF